MHKGSNNIREYNIDKFWSSVNTINRNKQKSGLDRDQEKIFADLELNAWLLTILPYLSPGVMFQFISDYKPLETNLDHTGLEMPIWQET